MYWETRQRLNDVASVSLIAAPIGLLARKASRSQGAFRRAGRNALIGASAAGALSGAFGFEEYKANDVGCEGKSLAATAEWVSFFAFYGGLASGIASLTWDAIGAKQR